MNINLKGTGVVMTAAMKSYATAKIESLEKFFEGIISVNVELAKTTKHHQKGDLWRAEANIRVPRRIIRAEAVDKTLYAAIDRLKDELKRELRSMKEKTRSKTRRLAASRPK
jgi:putative sigma-54 modulation protein